MVYRNCSSCNRNLPDSSYSNNQWRKGPGSSRCHSCVNGGHWHRETNQQPAPQNIIDVSQTARKNNATRATFTWQALDYPFAQGSFRWVAKGRYTQGSRAGQECVCKWFKTGGVLEASFFETDLETVQESLRLIKQWNSKGFVNKLVKINQPEVWTFDKDGRAAFAGKKVLQEPFISNYQKFNSNTGWSDDSMPWPRVMQALSHYSYHASNGKSLICDLQGGIYSDGVVLTDPVVMSLSRQYGPTDLGQAGMETFFFKPYL
mmetsp:Transcript_6765/g.9748  ORF Transcript_6765/g.9748 Transcript_6765/m.9748 type:complete len:261 (-) Transcript_6765:222-1004(-)